MNGNGELRFRLSDEDGEKHLSVGWMKVGRGAYSLGLVNFSFLPSAGGREVSALRVHNSNERLVSVPLLW